MSRDRRLRAPELLRPRLEVLKTGLHRVGKGEEEGAATVRRMGKVFLNWAIGEELEEVEKAAFSVVGAKGPTLLEAGGLLSDLLEEVVAGAGRADTDRFLVLVVEDNPDDAVLLQVGLKSNDRNINIVTTLEEAEQVLKGEEVALLVLDSRLPDGDGRSLLADVREEDRYEDLSILVVSGSEDPGIEAESLALGANGFFRKPIDPSALAAAASAALHREAQRRSNAQSDPLTGLLNRTAIRALWERWTFPDPSSIWMLGIDGFPALEDRLDHEVADAVIASVGGLFRDSIPRGCVSSRWGEATFLVFCPGFDREAATGLLRETLDGIRELNHKDPGGEMFRVTASGGVVEIKSGSVFDDAMEEAEALLEAAMESGGNTLAGTANGKTPLTILMAEDDPLSAGILIHRLEREGFRVLHFLDGAQALEGALAEQVDCAILDVKMPGMDGFELLERLRKVPTYYELPIVMLTSMGREEDIARGFDLGADDYMVKPFSPVEVLARIRRLLTR